MTITQRWRLRSPDGRYVSAQHNRITGELRPMLTNAALAYTWDHPHLEQIRTQFEAALGVTLTIESKPPTSNL